MHTSTELSVKLSISTNLSVETTFKVWKFHKLLSK